ncbi:hypothetical protein KPL48_24480 [Clostridium estertheticum]|nr:hypothetical protein [Clostridium estertheticum]
MKKAFKKSLKRFQLDYWDLYLIHKSFGDVYFNSTKDNKYRKER